MNNYSDYTNSIFEERWWIECVAPKCFNEIIIKEGDEIIARWAYAKKNNKIFMPKITQTMGYWISEKKIKDDKNKNIEKEIINKLIGKLPKTQIKLALDPKNTYFLPFIWKNFIIKPCITYRFEDISNIDAIFNNFSNIVKKNIKSAKNKVSIKEIDDIAPLFTLLEETFKLQKRKSPFPKEFIEKIYSEAKKHNAAKLIYAIDSENNFHSGTFFLYDKQVTYYLISASNPKFRNSGANSLLIWEGLKFASTVSEKFDFEGSMIEGIENFIRQFGAKETIYYEIRKLNLLNEFFEICKPRIKRLIGYKI